MFYYFLPKSTGVPIYSHRITSYNVCYTKLLRTLPLLIFFGLPATVANGTNRVGHGPKVRRALRGVKKPAGPAACLTGPEAHPNV